MQKQIFIKDFSTLVGMQISGEPFLIKKIEEAKSRDGSPYKNLILADKTGEIAGKIWRDFLSSCANVKTGEIASISGQVEEYKDKIQLRITQMTRIDKYDESDFIVVSQRSIEKMWEELENIIRGIKNPHLKNLLKSFFEKPQFADQFKKIPAGKKIHHAYFGGLLEHTLEMIDFARPAFSHYKQINEDLVLTAILLHDIGKLKSYKTDSLGVTETTEEGELLEHVFISASMVDHQMPSDFPEDLKIKLLHIILSHHGLLEYGSPVVPKTFEAILVNQVDNTSTDLNQVKRIIDQEGSSDKMFSGFDRILERSIYLPVSVKEEEGETS